MMKWKTSLVTLTMMGVMASGSWAAGIDEPAGSAVNMLSSLQDAGSVNYVNAEFLLDKQVMPPSLTEVKTQVLNENKRYLIDFSNIDSEADKSIAKDKLRQSLGLAMPGDMIVISAYKGELMFSQLEGEDDENIKLLEGASKSRVKRSLSLPAADDSIPNVAFYLNAKRPIYDYECNLTWNTYLGPVQSRYACDNAHISLIYKVNLQRSLRYEAAGTSTPDAKIVRIAIDDSSTGAGIHLNHQINKNVLVMRGIPWPEGGNEAELVTTAIARNYSFNFNASNDKANILRTVPASNLNANYSHKEVSTFNFGISGGVEVSEDGPKGKLDANASWSESKWLSFDTSDYRVERNTNDSKHVEFKWAREQYPTAESIKKTTIHGYTAGLTLPADTSLVNPIGYASFTPKMEVIYQASPEATGTTTLTLDSAVDITGFRYHTYVTGFFGVRTYYSKDSDNQVRRANKRVSFVVDWDHPVFTGGRPVNLQLASFNSKCISADNQQNVTVQECSEDDFQQAFIYSSTGQYVSAQNTKQCLDAEDLSRLQRCGANLSQRWQWQENSSQLQNKFTQEYLGHHKTTGELLLTPVIGSDDGDVNTDTYTSYVNVFGASTVEKNTDF